MPNKKKLYNTASLIIAEYEKAAINSATRPALFAMLVQPLTAAEALAQNSDRLLDMSVPTGENIERGEEEEEGRRNLFEIIRDGLRDGVTVETDFFPELEDTDFGRYLRDCLNCQGRMFFRWENPHQ
jgi:hypothetical protein